MMGEGDRCLPRGLWLDVSSSGSPAARATSWYLKMHVHHHARNGAHTVICSRLQLIEHPVAFLSTVTSLLRAF